MESGLYSVPTGLFNVTVPDIEIRQSLENPGRLQCTEVDSQSTADTPLTYDAFHIGFYDYDYLFFSYFKSESIFIGDT